MFELKGKYNTCKVFTDNADKACIDQLRTLLDQESLSGSKIRIMPDCHAGAGCVIGTTMTITDKAIPNLVGVDIGCGMRTVRLKEKEIDLPKLDRTIRENIPAGFAINTEAGRYADNANVRSLKCFGKSKVSEEVSVLSIGTLGGGNHFIEIDRDEYDNLYLVIHTGSRRLGKNVAEYYQQQAFESISGSGKNFKEKEREARQALIAQMKAQGRDREISSVLSKWSYTAPDGVKGEVPFELAYCEGKLFEDYISDMKAVEEYARWNRRSIADTIMEAMGLHPAEEFETVHNYIDTDHMILRKGAVSARKGEKILIPMNMRDGSLICIGKGNEDWNCSAPHGAGRSMSRAAARKDISMEDYRSTMDGIFSTSVSEGTIDESPFAYKPMEEIVKNIGDTAEIAGVIKPIYNFKAGAED